MKTKNGATAKKRGAAAKSRPAPKAKVKAKTRPKVRTASKNVRSAVKSGSSNTSGRAAKSGTAHRNGMTVKTGVKLPAGKSDYRPSDNEPFMNERQREYFRAKLLQWREDILKEAKETLQHLQDENQNHPDLADRASSETDRAIELRARDRQRKLIAKIDAAIARIDDGSYGYCEETGDPISLKRLEARPIATLSIEAQERHERRERVYRDD